MTNAETRVPTAGAASNGGDGHADGIAVGFDPDPTRSMSLHADAYVEPRWHEIEQSEVFARSWQWVGHVESLRDPGSYVTMDIAGMPVALVRGHDGELRAFYNVCQHRAHELLSGSGRTDSIVCGYHGWTYELTGRLSRARRTADVAGFDPSSICLSEVQAEEFGGFVYVNLDPAAAPLAEQSGGLGAEIARWAPDVADLTHVRRFHYDIASNWKNVVDNFLECYHCHVAHPDFVTLVEMDTYRVTTHGIYSSHMARAGYSANSAYDTSESAVKDLAVWWLWPNTCLMRYPGRGNFSVMQMVPAGPERTLETIDFYLETDELTETDEESIRYIDEVLQPEDIGIVESVQRGMRTPAFTQGRIVCDPGGSGLSEHGVHHFHGLMLDAYRRAGAA
ncbi:MAG: ring-hydroxylating oxygenase subunit alpha [Acidimicrobiaceae bacterium]|nr:ring-hydroxylating oxygenase subunit alpha [Acidimicrobiaceae bacterium]